LGSSTLHNVGKFWTFLKKCQKRGPTHVEAKITFFFQDFFGESKIGHFFCPFFKKAESPGQKKLLPLHIENLWSKTKIKILNL
jgi:hypothetical protein